MSLPQFASANHLFADVLKKLVASGTHVDTEQGGRMEGWSYAATLVRPDMNVVTIPTRELDASELAARVLWFLSGSQSVELPRVYSARFEDLGDENGNLFTAPGWRSDQQILAALELLVKEDGGDGAFISLRDIDDIDEEDQPSGIGVQFLRREGRLDAMAFVRTCDVWNELPHDLFLYTSLQCLMARALDVEIGWYGHHVGVMYLPGRDVKRAKKAAREWAHDPRTYSVHGRSLYSHVYPVAAEGYLTEPTALLRVEHHARTKDFSIFLQSSVGTYGNELLAACATRFIPQEVLDEIKGDRVRSTGIANLIVEEATRRIKHADS